MLKENKPPCLLHRHFFDYRRGFHFSFHICILGDPTLNRFINIFINETKKPSPMSRAVHRFECKGFLLCFEGEHVLAVMLPVSGGHPQLAVVDVGGHHLLKSPPSVLTLSKNKQKDIFLLRQTFDFQKTVQLHDCLTFAHITFFRRSLIYRQKQE